MPGHDLARELLAAARSDLKALKNMLDPEAFDDRVFGFHAQQAVEKALKSWLNYLQGSHPFTHDLSMLLHELEGCGANIEDYWDFADLSAYAVRFRYEALSDEEEPLDRERLLGDVRALVDGVMHLLS